MSDGKLFRSRGIYLLIHSARFFEVPSNIVLKLMRPSVWIAIIMFAWGLVVS